MEKDRRLPIYRVNVDISCRYQLLEMLGHPLTNGQSGSGLIINLSTGGALFKCPFNIPVATRALLRLEFRLGEADFALTGRVVRREVAPEPYCYGVKFTEIASDTAACLYDALRHYTGEADQESRSFFLVVLGGAARLRERSLATS